jgi:hypothetical protein
VASKIFMHERVEVNEKYILHDKERSNMFKLPCIVKGIKSI